MNTKKKEEMLCRTWIRFYEAYLRQGLSKEEATDRANIDLIPFETED